MTGMRIRAKPSLSVSANALKTAKTNDDNDYTYY